MASDMSSVAIPIGRFAPVALSRVNVSRVVVRIIPVAVRGATSG